MSKESIPGADTSAHTPDQGELPPELAAFLSQHQYACVTESTEGGTVYVMKAPSYEIDSVAGRMPMSVEHELHQRPSAPVIRTVIKLYDRPESALAFESYVNVADNSQLTELASLAAQETLLFVFYDEHLLRRLAKQFPWSADKRAKVGSLLIQAKQLLEGIPAGEFDFDKAKAEVLSATNL